MIALSAAGRARFEQFPDVLADDLFLDSLFSAARTRGAHLRHHRGRDAAPDPRPRRAADPRAPRERRPARGGRPAGVRASSRTSWFTDVVLRRPWLRTGGRRLRRAHPRRRPPRAAAAANGGSSTRRRAWREARTDGPSRRPQHLLPRHRRRRAATIDDDEARYWITADEYLRILDEIATWPATVISFDDGNASDVEIGLPGLLERGLTGTFFVLAGRLDTAGSVTTQQVAELGAAGMRVGSHGMDHVVVAVDVPRRPAPGARRGPRGHRRRSPGTSTEAALPRGQYDRGTLGRVAPAGVHGRAHLRPAPRDGRGVAPAAVQRDARRHAPDPGPGGTGPPAGRTGGRRSRPRGCSSAGADRHDAVRARRLAQVARAQQPAQRGPARLACRAGPGCPHGRRAPPRRRPSRPGPCRRPYRRSRLATSSRHSPGLPAEPPSRCTACAVGTNHVG